MGYFIKLLVYKINFTIKHIFNHVIIGTFKGVRIYY